MSAGATPERISEARTAVVATSASGTSLSSPPNVPMAVLAADTIQTSRWAIRYLVVAVLDDSLQNEQRYAAVYTVVDGRSYLAIRHNKCQRKREVP